MLQTLWNTHCTMPSPHLLLHPPLTLVHISSHSWLNGSTYNVTQCRHIIAVTVVLLMLSVSDSVLANVFSEPVR